MLALLSLGSLMLSASACSSSRESDVAANSVGPSSGNPFRIGRPLVIPHAGGDGLFPENTIFAYQRSLAMGADVVDIDVQLSADGVPMALHDATLDRTTNGSGRVSEHTAGELIVLDAGWAFDDGGGFPFRGQGITVPTIEQVLTAFPTQLTTLDMKDQRLVAVAPICELLVRLDRADTVYVGVDTDEQVLEFRRLCPSIHTSGTSAERTLMRAARESGDPAFTTKQLVSQPSYLGDDGQPRVTPESLAFSHSHDIAVLTYVVDDPAAMHDLIEMGIDGIYTRRPDLLIEALAE